MFKYVLIFVWMFSFVYAIEVQLKPDTSIDISTADADALKVYLKKRFKFRISDKGAKKVVRENRILANEYLKRGLLDDFEKKMLQIELETKLADKFVEHLQRKIKIPEETLKSYYYDHQEDFKESDKVTLQRYQFKDFNDAMQFYQEAKKNPDQKDQLLKRYHGKLLYKGEVEKDRLKRSISSFLNQSAEHTFLPPMVLRSNVVDVYYIDSYRQSKGYKPFEKVKKEIEDILYKKTFAREREKVLKQYVPKEESE